MCLHLASPSEAVSKVVVVVVVAGVAGVVVVVVVVRKSCRTCCGLRSRSTGARNALWQDRGPRFSTLPPPPDKYRPHRLGSVRKSRTRGICRVTRKGMQSFIKSTTAGHAKGLSLEHTGTSWLFFLNLRPYTPQYGALQPALRSE